MIVPVSDWRSAKPYFQGLSQLEKTCFPDAAWDQAVWQSLFSNRQMSMLFSIRNAQLIGFLAYSQVSGEAELLRIGISPSFRRMSFGSALLKAMVEGLVERGTKTVHLEVRRQNRSAISFYQAHGFKQVGIRKDYYGNPLDDAVLLAMALG